MVIHKYSSTNRRRRYAQQALHRELFFAYMLLHGELCVHKHIFTHRSLYTQRFSRKKLLHIETLHTDVLRKHVFACFAVCAAFTHRNLTHRRFYTQTLSQTETFTQKPLRKKNKYTKTCSSPLHQTVCFHSSPFRITNLYGLYFCFSFGSW